MDLELKRLQRDLKGFGCFKRVREGGGFKVGMLSVKYNNIPIYLGVLGLWLAYLKIFLLSPHCGHCCTVSHGLQG